jgi:hypothetical protein
METLQSKNPMDFPLTVMAANVDGNTHWIAVFVEKNEYVWLLFVFKGHTR